MKHDADSVRVPENGSDCDIDSIENEDKHIDSNTEIIKKKTKKRGIIYLSTIPPYMNVAKFENFSVNTAKLGGYIYNLVRSLEKNVRESQTNSQKGGLNFRKKVAKQVASNLNNTKIGTRKKSRYYDMIWNIKYIPRFKWVHLSERLAYERAAMKQRLQTEISQAKKEAHYLQNNVEKSKKLKRKKQL